MSKYFVTFNVYEQVNSSQATIDTYVVNNDWYVADTVAALLDGMEKSEEKWESNGFFIADIGVTKL